MDKLNIVSGLASIFMQLDDEIFYYTVSALIVTVIVMTVITVVYMFSRNTHLLKKQFSEQIISLTQEIRDISDCRK